MRQSSQEEEANINSKNKDVKVISAIRQIVFNDFHRRYEKLCLGFEHRF